MKGYQHTNRYDENISPGMLFALYVFNEHMRNSKGFFHFFFQNKILTASRVEADDRTYKHLKL